MLKNLATIICLITIFAIIKYGLKKNPTEVSKRAFLDLIGYFGNINIRAHERNMQKSRVTNEKTLTKSKNYKLIETMLFDLNMPDATVEGFIFGIVLFSFIINTIIFFYTFSIFLFIFGLIAVTIFLLVLAYMFSNKGHFEREFAVMAAEDLIAVNLASGAFKAIKGNLNLFDDKVKRYFEEFVSNIEDYKMSFNEAVDVLTLQLGDSFVKFASKLKEYDRTGKQGTLDTFKDDIDLNTMRRTEMMELEAVLDANNKMYLQTLSITGFVCGIFCASTPQLFKLAVSTFLGNIILVIVFCAVLGGFTYLQKLRS